MRSARSYSCRNGRGGVSTSLMNILKANLECLQSWIDINKFFVPFDTGNKAYDKDHAVAKERKKKMINHTKIHF